MKKHISLLLLTASLMLSSCALVGTSSSEQSKEQTTSETITSSQQTPQTSEHSAESSHDSSVISSSNETSSASSAEVSSSEAISSSIEVSSSSIEQSSSSYESTSSYEDSSSSSQESSSSDSGSSSSEQSSSVEPVHQHTFATTWSKDATHHWHDATCGHDVISDEDDHAWNTGEITTGATCTANGVKTYTCTVCGQTKEEPIGKTNHTLQHHDAEEATTIKDGNIEYWHCSVCEKNFSDENGTVEVTDVVIPATGTVTKYTITWKDYKGDTIDTSEVNEGSVPSYTGPSRPQDNVYTYSFKSWSPTPVAASKDTSYTATYNRTIRRNTNYLPNTVFFTNNKSWDHVRAYVWNSDTDKLSAWPGTEMTYFKTNEYGQRVYCISNIGNYKNIIFNNGASTPTKTVDLSYSSLASSKNAFYLLDEKIDGNYKAGTWLESADLEPNYSFKNNGQNILHAFDWKLSTIKANLDAIGAQGFTAIQLSPVQPVKDYTDSYDDTHAKWWRFYQPIGLCIGNSTTNLLFDTNDGAKELSELTEAAARKGIRIIADVIVNHLADDSTSEANVSRRLSPQVEQFNPEIYNDIYNTLHNPNPDSPYIKDYSSAYGIVRSDCFGKDLNTANPTVQNSVLKFLKDLVDCGVTGFRFDAAKHIETSHDDNSIKSNFWDNTLGAAITYASNQYGRTLWAYGETLNANEYDRYFNLYTYYAHFNAVTPPDDYGNVGVSAQNCVLWGESHDSYMSNRVANSDTGQDGVNSSYKNKGTWDSAINLLYFVRPNVTEKISVGGVGYHADWGWQNEQVLIANCR